MRTTWQWQEPEVVESAGSVLRGGTVLAEDVLLVEVVQHWHYPMPATWPPSPPAPPLLLRAVLHFHGWTCESLTRELRALAEADWTRAQTALHLELALDQRRLSDVRLVAPRVAGPIAQTAFPVVLHKGVGAR